MRLEGAYRPVRSPSPFVVIMLRGGQLPRFGGKIKLVLLFLCAFLICQYLFGGTMVPHVDYNVFQYYWRGGPRGAPEIAGSIRRGEHSPGNGDDDDAAVVVGGDDAGNMIIQYRKTDDPRLSSLRPVVLLVTTPSTNATPVAVGNNVTTSRSSGTIKTTTATATATTTTTRTITVNNTAVVTNGSVITDASNSTVAVDSNRTRTDPNTTTTTTVTSGMAGNTNAALMLPQADTQLRPCPLVPPVLVGPIKVWFDYPSYDELRKLYPFVEPGGHSKPAQCRARHRVAIVEGQTFNRAKLMNVGYAEASKLYDWQCYIFHDVDLLPEDDRNLYNCPEQDKPRHMSVAVDKFKYRLPYGSIFGGISAMTKEQFVKINGFSNDYWGWGGEDDDLSTRVNLGGFKISRYPAELARYKMIKHTTEKDNKINACRYPLMEKTKKRWKHDGLTNLKYKLLALEEQPLFTKIRVDLLEAESKKELSKDGITC